MTAAISRISDINLRLPRQHLKTPVFKCFLAMTGNSKFRGDTSASEVCVKVFNRLLQYTRNIAGKNSGQKILFALKRWLHGHCQGQRQYQNNQGMVTILSALIFI